MNTVIVGTGYWGQKILKRLEDNSFYNVIAKIDPVDVNVSTFHSWDLFKKNELFEETELVCIFTPPDSHAEIARDALKNGKHVICAKPFVTQECDSRELYALAKKNKKALLIDYTFEFDQAIHKLKELLPLIGEPTLMTSHRLNFGKFQKCGALVDLLPHDISIANFLFGRISGEATISQSSALYGKDFAHVFIKNKTPNIDLTMSWISPVKNRDLLIVGERGILRVDWDNFKINFILIERQKQIASQTFTFENGDALTKEFAAFSNLLKSGNYKETMKSQQHTTEFVCQIIEATK